ncbi:hypothetical protein M1466_02345, partial [Candidatus Dependentiae bacterium]|nr:hypothetical protein [Candidatus Dependentiae bacterium]
RLSQKKIEEIDVRLVPQECVPVSLDTTSPDAQGNWVAKRAFWQQASDAYETLLHANDQLFPLQMNFLTQRNEASKKIDAAFTAIGLGQGELRELITLLIEELQHEQGEQSLNEAERELMNELHDKQKELESVAQQIAIIDEIDAALEKAQAKMVEQIGKSRDFEKKAWADFKQIGFELNDKRAQELYYQIESYVQSNAAIINYLTHDLSNYMQETTQTLDQQLTVLNKSVDTMKEQGIELQDEYARLTQPESGSDLSRAHQEQMEVPPTPSWWQRILAWFGSLIHAITSLFR